MIKRADIGRSSLGLAVTAALLTAGSPAAAAVVYSFSEVGGDFVAASFTFTTNALITADQTVTPQTCTIAHGESCSTITFDAGPNGLGGTDDLLMFSYTSANGGSGSIFFFFQAGAFAAPGTYSDVGFPVGTPGAGNGAPATLTVSDGAGGVPEPAAWTMMLLGFGGLGAALRRRRASAYA